MNISDLFENSAEDRAKALSKTQIDDLAREEIKDKSLRDKNGDMIPLGSTLDQTGYGNSFVNFIKLILTLIRNPEDFEMMRWAYFGPKDEYGSDDFTGFSKEENKFALKALNIIKNPNLSGTEAYDQLVNFTDKSLPTVIGTDGLLALIRSYESNGNYNAINGGGNINITSTSVNDVIAWQRNDKNKHTPLMKHPRTGNYFHNSKAIGAYQFMPDTLERVAKKLNLLNAPCNEETQKAITTELLKEIGLEKFYSGDITTNKFMTKLSATWDAFPDPNRGSQTSYAKNKAKIDTTEMHEKLVGFKAAHEEAITNNKADSASSSTLKNDPAAKM